MVLSQAELRSLSIPGQGKGGWSHIPSYEGEMVDNSFPSEECCSRSYRLTFIGQSFGQENEVGSRIRESWEGGMREGQTRSRGP